MAEETLVDAPETGSGADTQTAGGDDTTQTPAGSETQTDSHTAWFEGLEDEELTTEEAQATLKKYPSQTDALKGLVGAQKVIGKKGFVPPAEDAGEDERNQFADQVTKALGRPDEADAYQWDPPEGLEIDDERHAEAREKLHGLRLTQDQFKGVMDLYADELQGGIAQTQEQQEQERNEAVNTLKTEWGDEYEERLGRAQKAIAKFGMTDRLKEMGLGNNLSVIQMFDQVASSVAEDTLEGEGSRATVQEQIKQIKESEEYRNERHPNHATVMQKIDQLYEKAYG